MIPLIVLHAFLLQEILLLRREGARNSQEIHGVNLLKADGHYLYLQMNGDEYIFEEGEKSVFKKQLKEEKKIYYYTHENILTLYVHYT
ncbi:hypothetical protein SAMN02787108_03234 [Lysinibacillus fusiformis]|nr:hypothetical protein SAMN02787108_03234 [Lysinibacillus fusiformis]SDB46123.1 hypothetical protein SAMN02787070_03429 [Lysinibacillus fusiformis]SFI72429.1 hypothetical protein SAMN02787080_03448 [Lysinibacillus fusiformis]SFT15454.1 hypothetical protein SAMN02787099_03149 [Lysinibacillus fusiformis]